MLPRQQCAVGSVPDSGTLPCFGMAPGSTSPRDYGAGTLIMGVVAPVIMAVLAVPVWIMFFNV